MNEKQYREFEHIARQCESSKNTSINVGGKIRRDAIVAVWHELNVRIIESRQLRKALYNLVKLADQEQNTSPVGLLDAMKQMRKFLGDDD